MLFGAVLIRAVCDGTITLFVPSGRIRAITQGDWSSSRFVFEQSCSAQSRLDSFIAVRAL